MATLDSVKRTLRQKARALSSGPTRPLSDLQYDAGFEILLQGPGRTTYQEFIVPQLSMLLAPLLASRNGISLLEIGPGPKSVLGSLSDSLRRQVKRYAAFEPNDIFATRLEEWLHSTSETGSPLPCLDSPPHIQRDSFGPPSNTSISTSTDTTGGTENMYGMEPKRNYIERALSMLHQRPEDGMVIVFHREGTLHLDGLTCHQTASYPTGVIRVADDDEVLDCFAAFITGHATSDTDADRAVRVEWRKICRALGRREEVSPDHLFFSAPNIMAAFTQHATTLPELTAQVPVVSGDIKVKNREACLHRPASIIRPKEIRHVQECVRWALNHGCGLTVVGGGHSGQCLWPNVVAVDMGSFDQVHVITVEEQGGTSDPHSDSLIVVEAGCKSGTIVSKAMTAGLAVPLGARPSVGAGLWLQGGIGHLARLHGLACDAIIGAVVVSVASGQVLCVGHVPSQHRPAGAVHQQNDDDLLWAMKGAGTNFGIVISVTFKAYPARAHSVRNWVVPLNDDLEARLRLSDFDTLVARELPRHCSADAYLYWDSDKLHLGMALFESSTTRSALATPTATSTRIGTVLGPEDSLEIVDGVGLFESEMYVSGMQGGHGGGKTSAFKRCVFLRHIGETDVVDFLVAAVKARPSPQCYLHLLHGGGAIGDVADHASAFGCRDWDFACVVTGVWPRDEDGTEVARAAVQWVYDVVMDLLPSSSGIYGADLGPDPRDAALATKAFGPNLPRLARLKRKLDPGNVLAYACPLPKAAKEPKLIMLVTGESCAGKDYCAEIWTSAFCQQGFTAHATSISDATKREYAAATGADPDRLLRDRAYKEQHRPALTTYFQDQLRQRPRLPEEHFLEVVYDAADMDVLLITGMRDEAPIAAFSHLVPDSRLLEVRVVASRDSRRARRGCDNGGTDADNMDTKDGSNRPNLVFTNDTTGSEAAKRFAEVYLLPCLHDDLQRLESMVRPVANYPRPGIDFRHVLDISQRPGGLALCTSLLQAHFMGDWTEVSAIACCETGGFVFASALAARVDVPLALIREARKLPPPTISIMKSPSHISSSASNDPKDRSIEMGRDVIPRGATVVVVDDVPATGETLCAVLQLLGEAGIGAEDVAVLVVAEFPVHRGREVLHRRGFGATMIQSLLVFGGV